MTGWSAAFLDRDGTINRAPTPARRYIRHAGELELLPGAAAAIRRLNDAGIWVAVVTNQRGVSRGWMTLADLDSIHARLESDLAAHGARLDAIYVCPHADASCGCRKPEPGMLDRAFAEHGRLERRHSVLIGDSRTDMLCAARAGISGIRVGEPDGSDPLDGPVAGSLVQAVDRLLDQEALR